MRVSRIEARCFRNIDSDQFDPGLGLNFLYGKNAQGKTNWLEATFLLATGTSFRTSRVSEAISHGATESIVRARIHSHGLEKDLGIQLTPRSKGLFINGKREPKSRYSGHLVAFVCSLEQMSVIRGEPHYRREFLDHGAMSIDPKYAKVLDTYGRVLKQKNRLLRQIAGQGSHPLPTDQIRSWNGQLIEYGSIIHRIRSQYVEKLQSVLNGNLFAREEIRVRHVSSLESHGDLSQYSTLLAERLDLRMKAELAVGYSLVGPHRDELEILVDGLDVRRFGSAGQQRSALLILDLARISVYNKLFDEQPVLLIDDIDAELDRQRIEVLLDDLQTKAQTFITTSKPDLAKEYTGCASLFHVEEGRLTPDPS